MEADKGMTLQEDGKNYGEFLLDTIESAKDKFTEDELKTLKSGAEEIKKIEEKLTMLEEKYPKVAEKAKENGSSSLLLRERTWTEKKLAARSCSPATK